VSESESAAGTFSSICLLHRMQHCNLDFIFAECQIVHLWGFPRRPSLSLLLASPLGLFSLFPAVLLSTVCEGPCFILFNLKANISGLLLVSVFYYCCPFLLSVPHTSLWKQVPDVLLEICGDAAKCWVSLIHHLPIPNPH
jgi:hypothetical protein